MIWYQLACGWPAPVLLEPGRFYVYEVALVARAARQADELPASEGGATWHVIRLEVM